MSEFKYIPLVWFAISTVCVCGIALSACDSACGDDFPEIYNSETDQDAEPMTAIAAASSFEVPDGFHVDVFASEPDVQNPIAMTWDARGRLWVAENFTYAERSQRFDLSLQDRVLIFEDADGDGVAEKRTVFADQIQLLTSVEVGHGGVWLMCPDKLLFVPDADRDDVPDGPAQVVLDGFTVAKENHHNFANGLKWGPDGWLYGRCGGSCPGRIGVPGTPPSQRVALEGGIWRYHPSKCSFEVLSHGTTNPWGHDWNEFGDAFFINTVNGHLWHLIPGAHFHRPFTLDPNPHAYELIDMHADHWHFDTTGDWTKSRDGAANSYGGGHAHCGMSIYLGDDWPDRYRGRLLTLNFHGRRINQEFLVRDGSGYVGKHGPDTLIAKDSFFRGMDLSYGPDGSVFALDWSDTGECHESTGVHRTSGRIYRVSANSDVKKTAKAIVDLHQMSSVELVGLMTHRNEWFVRQARLLLSERAMYAASNEKTEDASELTESKRLLRKLVEDADPVIAYRALATLAAMDAADANLLNELLLHSDEHLRAWAIRLLSDHWPIDDVFGPVHASTATARRVSAEAQELLATFCEIAKEDPSGLVRLSLASTLQRLPVGMRCELAATLLSRGEDAQDHNLPLLVWYGLIPVAKSNPNDLAEVACSKIWPTTQRLIARRLAEEIERAPDGVRAMLQYAMSADRECRHQLLSGIVDGLKGWSQAPPPNNWPDFVVVAERENDSEIMAMVRELSVIFGDGRAFDEVRGLVLDSNTEIGIRRTALETLVKSKDPEVVEICTRLLRDGRLNSVAIKGVERSDDKDVATELIKNYRRFRVHHRPKVIEVLAARPTFAAMLLDAIEEKKIPLADLTAFDVRQMRSLDVMELNERVASIWGMVRGTPAEKQKAISKFKRRLSPEVLATASLGNGRSLFNQSCSKCHRLFGYGERIGPELTGANRDNIDYLLENIVAPSAVVSKDYGMTIVMTVDGQVLNGLVVAKTEKTLTLQTQTDLKTIALDDVQEIKTTDQSPMPDGLLDNMSDDEVRDLIAYLRQPTQVPLPNDGNSKSH